MMEAIRRISMLLATGAFLFCGWGLNRFTNFGPVNEINDIAVDSSGVYVASSGGLFAFDQGSGAWRRYASTLDFPDVKLTALCHGAGGVLWVGSSRGYLSCWTPQSGAIRIYSSYAAAGWDITDICAYGTYLIIGSSKGLSVFDAVRGHAIGNATKLGAFANSSVHAVAVYKDVLYAGGNEGVASVDIFGDKLRRLNFYDRSIWANRFTEEPVVAFSEHNHSLQGFSRPTAFFGGAILQSDTSQVIYDSRPVFSLPSEVTCIAAAQGSCWIGTRENYLYEWRGAGDPVQHPFNGLAFGVLVRVAATADGGCWALTQISPNPGNSTNWNQGVVRCWADGNFATYNERNTAMGRLADFPQMRGLLVDRQGTLWVGASGGNVKRYDPPTNAWYQYYLSGLWVSGDFRLLDGSEWNYGKSDAIAQDSAGFIWISSYKNYAGCLIAYDSKHIDPAGHFRRHLPKDSPQIGGAETNIISLCVAAGARICAGTEDGNLFILTYENDPIAQDVTVIDKFSGLVTVKDLVAAPDSIVWAVCGQGLYAYNIRTRKLEKDTRIAEGLTSIEAETAGKLWLGTQSGGLIRYSVADSQQTRISKDQGLVNNAVNDLSIDRKNGFLWVATYDGLSRYSLLQGGGMLRDNARILVYPNPFSFSNPRHRAVTLQHVAPQSKVRIYDMKGQVLEDLFPVIRNDFEWTYVWTPRRNLIPGAYLYAAIPPLGRSAAGKLMITP